ncbi:MAG: arylesterase [Geminicoccaceae bacterium]|nr:arylesterase [Geminicoccaceae bacterium]
MVRWSGAGKLVLLLVLLGAAPATTARGAEPCRIAVLGDSLAAGYGVPLEDSFPSRLEDALKAEGFACEVVNAGVSGDTSAGGLARLDWVLADDPSHLVVELGGNDGLRALPVDALERNLDTILDRAEAAGVPAFLAGMEAPPNMGTAYTTAFRKAYADTAAAHGVPLDPFFLKGAIDGRGLMQGDGIHPNPEGVKRIVARILPLVTAWLEATGQKRG